jgi:PPE-repeat protein
LTTAASSWNAIAAELQSAALSYQAVVAQLSSDEWTGTASAAMAQAATPYAEWLTITAAQAEQAAVQASAAAAAYETAFSAVVPPPLIATNRTLTQQLIQTNVLGQNTPTIAQLEAQYGEMWAQDAAAMYSYAGQSASASKVEQFTAAPQVANPSAQATQGAATAGVTANATANKSVTSTLQALAQPAAQAPVKAAATPAAAAANNPLEELWFLLTGQTSFPTNLGTAVNGYSPFASLFYNTEGLPYFSVGMGNFGVQIAKSAGWLGGAAPAIAKALPGLGGLGGMLGGGAAAAHPVAAIGSAASVGKLSVPVSWSGPATAAPMLGHAVPVSSISAAPEAGGPGNLLGGMPLAGVGAGGHGAAGPKYGFRPTVMARPPFAG